MLWELLPRSGWGWGWVFGLGWVSGLGCECMLGLGLGLGMGMGMGSGLGLGVGVLVGLGPRAACHSPLHFVANRLTGGRNLSTLRARSSHPDRCTPGGQTRTLVKPHRQTRARTRLPPRAAPLVNGNLVTFRPLPSPPADAHEPLARAFGRAFRLLLVWPRA